MMELGSDRMPQILGLCKGSFSFCSATERHKSTAFHVPGTSKVGVQPDGFIEGLDGLFMLALGKEDTAFVAPGQGIVGVEPNGLIISFDCFLIFALEI
jgi:hypothetical protein